MPLSPEEEKAFNRRRRQLGVLPTAERLSLLEEAVFKLTQAAGIEYPPAMSAEKEAELFPDRLSARKKS